LLQKELLPKLGKDVAVTSVHYYGTGLSNANNIKSIKAALKNYFPQQLLKPIQIYWRQQEHYAVTEKELPAF